MKVKSNLEWQHANVANEKNHKMAYDEKMSKLIRYNFRDLAKMFINYSTHLKLDLAYT